MALIDLLAPVVETTAIRFATEEVEILLAHKVLSSVDGVSRYDCISRGSEHRVGLVRHQRERAVPRTEMVIDQFRRNCIEAADVDVPEAIVAVAIADCRNRVRTGKAHNDSSERRAGRSYYAPADRRRGCRGCNCFANSPIREAGGASQGRRMRAGVNAAAQERDGCPARNTYDFV